MKLIICLATIAVILVGFTTEALPQRVTVHNLLYRPPPRPQPRPPIRVRRQVLGGTVSSNPAGGQNVHLGLTQGIGTPNHNLVGQAFATGNTNGGPVTTGGALNYNLNGHGIGLTKTHTPGVQDSFKQSVNANLFNNGIHRVDANAFASQNKLANGFKFERNGGGLEWNHINGHSANAGLSNIPGIGRQFDLGAKANLWQSQDRATRLDLTGGASKWLSGPFSGQTNKFGGLGLTHTFG